MFKKLLKTFYHNLKKIYLFFRNIIENLYLSKLRKKVKPYDLTILSNDCLGGVMYHQLGLKFCSPFINLWVEIDDYIDICENFDFFINSEIKEEKSDFSFPVGYLMIKSKKVFIHFNHDNSYSDAYEKWEKRKKRIIKEKVVCIFNLTNILNDKEVKSHINKIKEANINFPTYVFIRKGVCIGLIENFVYEIDFKNRRYEKAQILHKMNFYQKRYIDQFDYRLLFKEKN